MKLLERAKSILFTPRTEWRVIEQESSGMSELYLGYVAILAAIPELANLVGQSVVGAYKPLVPASRARWSPMPRPSPRCIWSRW